ncbi:tRNA-dihydrouridine synthase family protein, partial [Clostridium botulinum]
MKYYLAPMEGITGYIYRNSYEKFFSNIHKYFTPFIIPNKSTSLKTKELRDILPENNKGMNIVPQILTNDSEGFIITARKLQQLGYNEINLNLGCPAGTVVSKNRGSGFLAKREELDIFLDEIFKIDDIKISIKTRIGKDSPEEFYELIKIYNKYPIEELIIHPRTQKDFYGNKPNLDVFKDALSLSSNPICYNGDIFTASNYNRLIKTFPKVKTIMLGRGILANPGLINEIKNNTTIDKEVLKEFHDE